MSLSYVHFVVHSYQVNAYLIYDTTTLDTFLIDPAAEGSQQRMMICNAIKSMGLRPKAVVNTHLHLDHTASNVYFSDLYKIPVYAHRGDEFMLNDKDFLRERADRIPLEGLGKIDVYLEDEQLLPLGDSSLRVIHTPGHSPGGVCLYAEKEGFLVSGDSLFFESIGRTDLPRSNHSALLKNIVQRLFCLPDETVVLPGHDAFTTIGHERKFSPFF